VICVSGAETSPGRSAEAGDSRAEGAEGTPRSLRTADRLALAIFDLLKDLSVADRRPVLGELDAVERPAASTRERVALLALERCCGDLDVPVPSKGRYERSRLALEEPGVPSARFVAGTFGGWARALDAAGLEPTPDLRVMRLRSLTRLASDEEILAGLRQCAAEVGEPLRFGVYREGAREREMRASDDLPVLPLSPTSFLCRFGSFANALARAGLDARGRGPRVARSDSRALGPAAVRAAHAATAPPALTFEAYGVWRSRELARLEEQRGIAVAIWPSRSQLSRAYGSWLHAVDAATTLAGEPLAAGAPSERGRSRVAHRYIRSDLILAIQRCRLALGEWPTSRAYGHWRRLTLRASRQHGHADAIPSVDAITRRFGTWTRATQLASAPASYPTRPRPQRRGDESASGRAVTVRWRRAASSFDGDAMTARRADQGSVVWPRYPAADLRVRLGPLNRSCG